MTSVPCTQVMYSDGEQPVSLGETLVKAGYAKLVNWGLEMMSVNAFNLREAERNAKQQRVGIWRNYVAPATAGQSVTLSMPQSLTILQICILTLNMPHFKTVHVCAVAGPSRQIYAVVECGVCLAVCICCLLSLTPFQTLVTQKS